MKNYRRIIALVMCAIISVATIPVTAFAGKEQTVVAGTKAGNIIAGELNVVLEEPYYSYGDSYPDLRDILPEIEIESYCDICLSVITASKKPAEESKSVIVDRVGTEFSITLTEKTEEATLYAVEILNNNPYVKYVNPNAHIRFADTFPNDPLFDLNGDYSKWGVENIGAPEAWDYITGSDATDGSELDNYVKVAVIDSGVYDQHPDLVNNLDMSLAYNAYTQTLGSTYDYIGHGTPVAGIIGAEGNNSIGVAGVCWNVKMVPIKVANDLTNDADMGAIVEALDYAAYNEIYIANLSVAFDESYTCLQQAISNYSADGGLLVISAGNDNANLDNNTFYTNLSNISGVIIVGALDYDEDDVSINMKADFSNYGANVVDLFAPGVEILSTYLESPYPEYIPYEYVSGTSMAAPYVTGSAALIKSANTSYGASTIKKRILDNVTTESYLTNYCSTGGRLNIPDALYDMGYQVIISNTMTHGTVLPSAIFAKPNNIVYLTAYPDAGYMLKPGTMKHNMTNTMQISKRRCFFAMAYVDETITAQFYMVGDIDFDGVVTVADALAAMRHYTGQGTLTGDAFLAADVNGDGDVDLTDALTIQRFAAHLIDHFPIEE